MKINTTIVNKVNEVCKELHYLERDDLALLFARCYVNTWETTVQRLKNGETFVITGDIPAMWLRDSAAQVNHYIELAKCDNEIYETIKGIIARYAKYVNIDPYANAFNKSPNNHGHKSDITFRSPWVWERKYEVDSLCSVIALPYKLYKATGRTDLFTDELKRAFETIADLFIKEQRHDEFSKYTFYRETPREVDNMPNGGKGNPVAYTGMTWCGFRPSDDSCKYNYLIPSEMYAVVTMKYLCEIARNVYGCEELAGKAETLAAQIDKGIKTYGITEHPKYGKIYAFETNGLGNYNIMDDPNSPSLLAAPYIGYCSENDVIYQNTRKMIFSEDNPYYFEGKILKGIGSPHTGRDMVWTIGLSLQGLTTEDIGEIEKVLTILSRSHSGTYYMHEAIDCNDEKNYTRPWFAWANSLFSELVLKYVSLKKKKTRFAVENHLKA